MDIHFFAGKFGDCGGVVISGSRLVKRSRVAAFRVGPRGTAIAAL
jgi:hypothetical protein